MNPAGARFLGVEGAKWSRWARLLGRFAGIQVTVQALGAITGVVIVRLLDKDEYALFTIATSLQAAALLMTDCGINAGLLSIGGQIWGDRDAMGRLVSSAARLRRVMALAAGLVIAPISMWMLMRNGASVALSLALSLMVVAAVQLASATATYMAVLKLNARHENLQAIDGTAAAVRLAAMIAASLMILNAAAAMFISTLVQWGQLIATRARAALHFSRALERQLSYDDKLNQLVRDNFVFSLYVAVQGQIAVLVLSFTGTPGQIADIGALSRLAVIAAIVTTFLNYVASPIFAREMSKLRLANAIGASMAGATVIGMSLVAVCYFFPTEILWIFGPGYQHLAHELLLVALTLALHLYLAVLWAANTARAWLHRSWILAPLTIGLQLLLAQYLELGSVAGILWFSMLSQVPNLLWSMTMTLRGLASPLPAIGR